MRVPRREENKTRRTDPSTGISNSFATWFFITVGCAWAVLFAVALVVPLPYG